MSVAKNIQFSPRSVFIFAFLLAVFAAICITYIVSPYFNVGKHFGGIDHDGYIEVARNIVQGEGFVFEPGGSPPIHRPPAYAFFLIPIAMLPDFLQRLGVIILNSIFVGGTACLLFKFSAKFFNSRLALISLLIFILNPWVLWYVKNPTVVHIQMFFFTAFFVLILHLFFQPGDSLLKTSIWGSVLLGLVGGISALTHGIMLPLVISVLFVPILLGVIKRRMDWIRLTSFAMVVFFLIVGLWTYRNWQVTGRFIPVVSNTGLLYFAGNAHWGIGTSDLKIDSLEKERTLYQGQGIHDFQRILLFAGVDRPFSEVLHFYGIKDPELDSRLNKKAVHHALQNLDKLVKKFFLNGIEFYFPIVYYIYPPSFLSLSQHPVMTRVLKDCSTVEIIQSLYFFLLWIFAILGIGYSIYSRSKTKDLIILLGVIFIIIGSYLPFLVYVMHSRYAFTTLPFLSLLSASGILLVRDKFWKVKTA